MHGVGTFQGWHACPRDLLLQVTLRSFTMWVVTARVPGGGRRLALAQSACLFSGLSNVPGHWMVCLLLGWGMSYSWQSQPQMPFAPSSLWPGSSLCDISKEPSFLLSLTTFPSSLLTKYICSFSKRDVGGGRENQEKGNTSSKIWSLLRTGNWPPAEQTCKELLALVETLCLPADTLSPRHFFLV